MKIERINQNQIRCTLYREDLEDRKLRLSELAYGSDKARELFHDMLEQAADEVGFEAENIPLMIEAIPASKDCLILVVTKVGSEDEDEDEDTDDDYLLEEDYGHDDFIPLSSVIKQLNENRMEENGSCKCFSFVCLDDVWNLAYMTGKDYHGQNTLFRQKNGAYILALYPDMEHPEEFTRTCNMASEFGQYLPAVSSLSVSQEGGSQKTNAWLSCLEEHGRVICKENALQRLASC